MPCYYCSSWSFVVALIVIYLSLGAHEIPSRDKVMAQELASSWDKLFERHEGWLAADGIYSLDLTNDTIDHDLNTNTGSDSNTNSDSLDLISKREPKKILFWFSDTFGGTTCNNGINFAKIQMTNHSFALLKGNEPKRERIEFFWRRGKEQDEVLEKRNLLGMKCWLQDGCIYRGRIWISALHVNRAWKPERIDAISIGLDDENKPDFNDLQIKESVPLTFKTNIKQVVLGAAICDDAQEDYLYIYGYVDHLKSGSRKDLVVARVLRNSFDDYSCWRYFNGTSWSSKLADLCQPKAALVPDIAAEYSVSKIRFGKNKGKYLLVYTPGVISNKVAFRIAESPTGPFSREVVFYQSTVPSLFEKGVQCYNAKAHPALGDNKRILVSYHVNRLGTLPRSPAEYRPRFIWLNYQTIDTILSSEDIDTKNTKP